MKHFLSTFFIFAVLTSPAFAGKFETASKAKNEALRELVAVSKKIIKNGKVTGDAASAAVYDATRGEDQSDIKLVKQLNHMKAGLNSDDSSGEEMQSTSAAKLADYLFEESESNDEPAAFEAAKKDFTAAMKAVKANKSLKIYGTNHADEDGSWHVIDVLDTKNDQIVVIQMGYTGT